MSKNLLESAHHQHVFISYKRRWGILTVYGIANCMNAFLWICFAPIASLTQSFFGVSALAVNMLSLSFMILYPVGSVLATFIETAYGLRAQLLLGTGLNAVCAWIRYFGALMVAPLGTEAGFAVVMIGQIVGAIAQPVFTNAPARIAGAWFGTKEREIATTVGSMSNPVGNALGSVVPGLAVVVAGDIPALLLGQAVVCTVNVVLTWWVATDKPPTPPSAAAAHRDEERQHLMSSGGSGSSGSSGGAEAAEAAEEAGSSKHHHLTPRAALAALWSDYKLLLANRNFLLLAAGFGIGLGLFNAILTLIAQLLQPCGYGADTAGTAGAALLGAGLSAAAIAGVVLTKTHAYVPMLRGGILAAVGAAIFMLASLQPDKEAQLTASFALLGFCLIPLLPISLENCSECTYPIAEDASSSLLLTIGQIVGIILIFALTPVLETSGCDTVVTTQAGIILGVLLVGTAFLLPFKKDYRRQAAEVADAQEAAAEGAAAAAATTAAVEVGRAPNV